MVGDHRVGVVPADRFVPVAAGPDDHRMGQSALLPEPVVGVLQQFGHGVGGKEIRIDGARGRLFSHRFRTVLAELGWLAVSGSFWPRATGAVEPVPLIQPGQGSCGPDRTHLLESPFERDQYRGDSCGIRLVGGDFEVVLVEDVPVNLCVHSFSRTNRGADSASTSPSR